MSKRYPRRWFVKQIEKYWVRISYNKYSIVWFGWHFNYRFPTGMPYYEFSHKLCPFDFTRAVTSTVTTHG